MSIIRKPPHKRFFISSKLPANTVWVKPYSPPVTSVPNPLPAHRTQLLAVSRNTYHVDMVRQNVRSPLALLEAARGNLPIYLLYKIEYTS